MKLWTDLKNTFRKPTPLEIATVELVEAEHAKLEAETGREFADAAVTYNTARIKRLTKYVNDLTSKEVK